MFEAYGLAVFGRRRTAPAVTARGVAGGEPSGDQGT